MVSFDQSHRRLEFPVLLPVLHALNDSWPPHQKTTGPPAHNNASNRWTIASQWLNLLRWSVSSSLYWWLYYKLVNVSHCAPRKKREHFLSTRTEHPNLIIIKLRVLQIVVLICLIYVNLDRCMILHLKFLSDNLKVQVMGIESFDDKFLYFSLGTWILVSSKHSTSRDHIHP